MNVVFKTSFLRDVKKIKMQHILEQISIVIESSEKSQHISDVPNIKQIKGSRNYFRIRIGSYRIGLALDNGILYFVRCLPRKDIYKLFP